MVYKTFIDIEIHVEDCRVYWFDELGLFQSQYTELGNPLVFLYPRG